MFLSNGTKGYIRSGIIFYIFLLALFLLTSRGIDYSDIFVRGRTFLVPTILLIIVRYIQKENSFAPPLWTLLVFSYSSILWGIILPTVNILTDYTQYVNSSYEILFGAYLFLFFIAIRNFLVNKCEKIIWCILSMLLSIVPIAEMIYVSIYGKMLSGTDFLAMLQTPSSVWWEWVNTYVGLLGIALIIVVIAAWNIFVVKVSFHTSTVILPSKKKLLLLCIGILVLCYCGILFGKTWETSAWRGAQNYIEEEKQFLTDHGESYENLRLEHPNDTLACKVPGTVILVIGESASRDHMKCYRPDYPYDDTPWWSAMQTNPNFIQFSNVYACYNQTAVALSEVLTEKSQYNDKEFRDSCTILDIAKKAGYKTYWITSQGLGGKDNSAISLIGETADITETVESKNGKAAYDKDILPIMMNLANKNENNFIVLHIWGSHGKYDWRYPDTDTVFPKDDAEGNYANTIHYTDDFLREVFDYAHKNLNLQLMLYVSDHGENIYKGHNPKLTGFDQVRIPMFIYFSPNYERIFQSKIKVLQGRKNECYSNDMLYNTLSGLLNAKSNNYDAREDLSSEKYRFDRNTVLTFLGKRYISEDDDLSFDN